MSEDLPECVRRHDELHQAGKPMPGPWHWEIHDESMATLCGGGEDAIVGHIMSIGPYGSCAKRSEEWLWGRCHTPSEENARLIAAAPDMLAALKSVAKWLLDTEAVKDDGFWNTAFVKANNLTLAAIAKAEGRT